MEIELSKPDGIPMTEIEKDGLTDWTDEQEVRLEELFKKFEPFNGNITNVLAARIKALRQ